MGNEPIDRRLFLRIAAGAGAALLPAWRLSAQEPRKPNIVVFMADDQGYGDLGCHGSDRVTTPNIDRMAAEGIRFTNFYAPAASCSPTRTGILAGRNPFRLGVYTYIPNNSAMHLKREERSIGAVLRDAGYDTCFVGKWGANGSLTGDQPQPNDHGFDYWLAAQNNAIPSHLNPTSFVRNGVECGEIKGYSAAIIVDEAIQWLERRPDPARPFCLFVWFQEPHRVIATPEEFTAPYRARFGDSKGDAADAAKGQKETPSLAEYLGNLSHIDHQVGRLMGALDRLGVGDDTFAVYTSDNGPIAPGSTGGLRGGKGTLWEGGIRMPGIFRWPRSIKPGQVCDTPAGAIDLLPTICAISGAPLPEGRALDGTNIAPLFDGGTIERSTPLFWRRIGGDAALRDGDWKLHGFPGSRLPSQSTIDFIAEAQLVRFELHNLRDDPAETTNLAEAEKARTERMANALIALYRETQKEGERWAEKALPKDRE